MTVQDLIESQVKDHAEVANKLLQNCKEDIYLLAQAIIKAYREGNKVLLFGNGGSAADAQHLAADLVGRLSKDRRAFAAIALTGNSSNVTAIANDYGFENIFERQVEALAQPGDVLIGISTSGNSKNVINALKKGQEMGCVCGGLAGENKTIMANHCSVLVHVPSAQTVRIQEMHILIGHILCMAVENELAFG